MTFLTLRKLPHRINMVWLLMLIPLAAVTAFSVALLLRLPDFAKSFSNYADIHKQGDALSRVLERARNDHIVINEGRDPSMVTHFKTNIAELRQGVKTLVEHPEFKDFARDATELDEMAAEYAAAVDESNAMFALVAANELPSGINTLRSDLQVALDPVFISTANRIFEINQDFGCQSRLASSQEFRERIEALRLRLDKLPLSVVDALRIQSNINTIRGQFAKLLLVCQDLERAQETADNSYAALDEALASFLNRIDASILVRIDAYIDSETNVLAALSAVVLVVFLGGFAATLVFSARFGRQLNAVIRSIRDIARGQRSAEVPFLGSNDEFGEIATHVEQFRKNAIVLDEAVVAARGANEAKTQFLAAVSHELRTPLNAILGFSEVMRDGTFGALPSIYRSYAMDIHTSGQSLLDQISQILDLSKVELGRQDVDLVENDIVGIVEIALRRLERKIAAMGLSVSWHHSQNQVVVFDRGHLVQVVTNVLDNAVKYNRAGGTIGIDISLIGDHVRLEISDTGDGMEEKEIARAHEPFVQFGGAKDSLQGVGLGLSIVTKLLEINRGNMIITSNKHIGTRVAIWMAAARKLGERSVA
jgi:signal transduction histidine kinase